MAIVKSISKKQYIGKVHDLTVKNTHTYNIEGMAVHNSGCGSLVLFCLGVTGIDPLKHDLSMDRFLYSEAEYHIGLNEVYKNETEKDWECFGTGNKTRKLTKEENDRKNKLFVYIKQHGIKNNIALDEKQKNRILQELSFVKEKITMIDDIFSLIEYRDKNGAGTLNNNNSFLLEYLGITTQKCDLSKEFSFKYKIDKKQSRVSPPDIDVDFEERTTLLDYLCNLYGSENVALISVATSYKAKAAIQHAAKALDITKTNKVEDKRFSTENTQEAIRISKIMIQSPLTIKQWLGEDPDYEPKNKRFKEAMDLLQIEKQKYPKLFEVAKQLEGRIKSFGTHAAGVVISSRPIVEDIPMFYAKVLKESDSGYYEEGEMPDFMTTQFDKDEVEEIGLLKFDFLQIKNLRQITLALELIQEKYGKLDFDIDNLEYNDPKVFKTIDDMKLEGLFQIGGDTFCGKEFPLFDKKTGEPLINDKGKNKGKQRVFKVKGVTEIIGCNDFKDIVAMNAISRPGPLAMNVPEMYAQGKKDPESIRYIHPKLEPILSETYGTLCLSGDTEIYDYNSGNFYTLSEAFGSQVSVQTQNNMSEETIIKNRQIVYNGYKECVRLTFRDGSFVDCTPDHKFWTEKGWITADKAKGKYLAFSKKIITRKRAVYTKERARILGMLVGDGILNSYHVVLCCKTKEYLEYFNSLVSLEFPEDKITSYWHCRCNYASVNSGKSNNSSEILRFTRSIGVQGCLAQTKKIPEYLFGSSDEEKINFLIGYFDTDGHIGLCKQNRLELSFKTVSKKLAHDTKKMLLTLGYDSSIYFCSFKGIESYQIDIEEKSRFIEEVLLCSNSLKIERIQKIVAEKEENQVYRKNTKSRLNTFDREKMFKYISSKYENFSRRRLEDVTGFRRGNFKKTNRERITFGALYNLNLEDYEDANFNWKSVKSIDSIGLREVYDVLNCGDKRRFTLANGLISSNCYQESLIKMSMEMAGFTFAEADKLRKACAKKDKTLLDAIGEKFIAGCKKNNVEQRVVDELYRTIVEFGEYAFNKAHCLAGDTLVYDKRTNTLTKVEDIYPGARIDSYLDGKIVEDEVVELFQTGRQEIVEIELETGMKIKCTEKHKFLCADEEYRTVIDIIKERHKIITEIHNHPDFRKKSKISRIKFLGIEPTFNIMMKSEQHNYVITDRMAHTCISKNSVAYGAICYQTAYLKTYYTTEFLCTLLTGAVQESSEKKDKITAKLMKEYPELEILGPDINLSRSYYVPAGEMKIISPFISLSGIGQKVSDEIIQKRDNVKSFKSIDHLLSSVNSGSKNTMTLGLTELFIDNNVIKEHTFGSKAAMKIEAKRYFSMKNMVSRKRSDLPFQNALF